MRSLLVLMCLICFSVPSLANTRQPALSNSKTIKVLIALGPSTFFMRDGRAHGVDYAWLLEFEKHINRGRTAAQQRRLRFIPVAQSELIPALYAGRGDMAAGLLPAFVAVQSLVLRTHTVVADQWCVVSHRDAPEWPNLDALQDTPLVLPSVSYGRRLVIDANQQRSAEGLTELQTQDAGLDSSHEDIFREIQTNTEMIGLSSRTLLRLWLPIFPNLKRSACLSQPVPIVWAVNKNKPALLDELNQFIAGRKQDFVAKGLALTRQYLHPDGVQERTGMVDPFGKIAEFAALFRASADANNLDWLLLAAIGQRETGLRHVLRNKGPTGIMQINPQTAHTVGIKNPQQAASNIEAAARYLRALQKRYSIPGLSEEERMFFMLAAYNAGEGRVQRLRRKAAEQGLDQNLWHGHVEAVARQEVGPHLANYVAAVMRHYLAFQLVERRGLPEDDIPLGEPAVSADLLQLEASSVATAAN